MINGRQVVILSGVSGAGKSTYADKLVMSSRATSRDIVSADHFFGTTYRFDASKLGEAHAVCFRKFIIALEHGHLGSTALVVVDNTNTTVEEIAPYVLGAQAFGYAVELVTFITSDPNKAYLRNVHGVGLDAVANQQRRIEDRATPPWWTQRFIELCVCGDGLCMECDDHGMVSA